MSGNLEVRNVSSGISNHIEFETRRDALTAFVESLQALLAESDSDLFHVQIQRRGAAPPPGGSLPINEKDEAKITIHQFPE